MSSGRKLPNWDKFWTWFLAYLDERSEQVWQQVVRPVLPEADGATARDDRMTKAMFYTVVAEIANHLQEDLQHAHKQHSLLAMRRQLVSKQLLRSGGLVVDQLSIQLVFQITGWITGLWDPKPEASTEFLAVVNNGRQPRRQNLTYNSTIQRQEAKIDAANQSLELFMNRFGELLPVPQIVIRQDSDGGLEAGPQYINSQYLAFEGLQQVLGFQVEWTRTLAQHLDYDERNKTLYLFAQPSLCRVLYRDDPTTLLSKIFDRRWTSDVNSSPVNAHTRLRRIGIETLLAEVLLTYRLLFGRSSKSRIVAEPWFADCDRHHPRFPPDPFLRTLCTKGTEDQDIKALYSDLDADSIEDQEHVSLAEFPFLGNRILVLQNLSMSRQPNSITNLWRDRRNPALWFAIWAVLIIAGVTLVLQATQMLFQVVQMVLEIVQFVHDKGRPTANLLDTLLPQQ